MYVTIMGKRYRLLLVAPSKMPRDASGTCNAPHDTSKTIKIENGLPEQDSLRVAIHEIWHAADWHKDEAYIDRASTDMARILWRLGWRKNQ